MSLIWFCNVINPIVCFLNWVVYYWVYPISMFSIKDESVNVGEVVECSLKKTSWIERVNPLVATFEDP